MTLKIQIVSDLHLEFYSEKKIFNFITPSADILALLGDICCVSSDNDFEIFKRFIYEILPKYKYIIMVAGNHEFYYNESKSKPPDIINTLEYCHIKIKNFFKKTSTKLFYLNNSELNITVNNKNYIILGSTLWSYIPKSCEENIEKLMSDYKYIYTYDKKNKNVRNIKVNDITKLFNKNYNYIKNQIEKNKNTNNKMIILSHHKPYNNKNYNENGFDPAYSSNCLSIINNKIVTLWAYGHCHIYDNAIINGVHFYSNCKGYPYQHTNFNKSEFVKI